MGTASQSLFLQALGWAMVSSLGQMAVLWCCFAAARQLLSLSPAKKYLLSVGAITAGFAMFVATFLSVYLGGVPSALPFTGTPLASSRAVTLCLTAASATYLLLLLVPAYRLAAAWKRVHRLKTRGLKKAGVEYRLFLKKTAAHFGIKKPVGLALSDMVTAPLLIGYLKPVILLPVASVCSLSPQQVEAVILHELAHIRRHDYLVNVWISIIQTFLYFNPFIKFFVQAAQNDREYCCDDMVLQAGYNRADYASALLTLERASAAPPPLAIGAAGKNSLLTRIEKIAGLEKRPPFRFHHFALLAASVLCIFFINAVLLSRTEPPLAAAPVHLPVAGMRTPPAVKDILPAAPSYRSKKEGTALTRQSAPIPEREAPQPKVILVEETLVFRMPRPGTVFVRLDEADASLSAAEKRRVTATVEATKKALKTVQWKKVETAIADALTAEEKELARQQYLHHLALIDWNAIEKSLKSGYRSMDWAEINAWLAGAVLSARLDSLEHSFELALQQIESAERHSNDTTITLPFPDEPASEIQRHKEALENSLRAIRELKAGREVIRL